MQRISFKLGAAAAMIMALLAGADYAAAFKAPEADKAKAAVQAPGRQATPPSRLALQPIRLRSRTMLAEVSPKSLLAEARSEARTISVQKDELGYQHIRYAQYYQGLPVIGAQLIAHINDKNETYQISGQYAPDIKASLKPAVRADQALGLGIAEQQGKPALQVTEKPSLVIFAGQLAYQYVLSHGGQPPGQWVYFVDAQTGKLLSRYNNIKYAAPTSNGTNVTVSGNRLIDEDGTSVSIPGWQEYTGQFYLYSLQKEYGIYDTDALDWEQNPTQDWGVVDRAAVSAANNLWQTQQYVATVLGRNSFDNAGAFAVGNVHEGDYYVNAYWNGTDFHFGDGDGYYANPLTSLDIVAHEYGHAITQYTSNLIYSYESGALNESYSDIFGTAVEFATQPDGRSSYPNATAGRADWLCAEDAWLIDVALRDLRNPQRYGQPSYYQGTNWYTGSGDNGGVHTNSGVQNFAYYLLAEGGSGVNDGHAYTISGLGVQAATAIALRANMVYLTPDAQYFDSRAAWIDAATDLGYDAQVVEDVWTACGVTGVPETAQCPYEAEEIPYQFDDISTTGTNLGMVCDDCSTEISIPFNFSFYCSDYNALYVSSNGTLSFTSNSTPYLNDRLPSTSALTTFIAPLWDDLEVGAGGSAIYYQAKGTAPQRKFIIQYNNVPHYSAIGAATFEVILYEETSAVEFHYKDVNFDNSSFTNGLSATVGIQKNATTATQYSYNTASLHDGFALRFHALPTTPDQIMLIRKPTPDRFNLAVYHVPDAPRGDIGKPVATDVDIGSTFLSGTAGQWDENPADEFVWLTRADLTNQIKNRLNVHNMPTEVMGNITKLASDVTFGLNNRQLIAMGNFIGNGVEQLLVVRKNSTAWGMYVYELPDGIKGDAILVASDPSFGSSDILGVAAADFDGDGLDEAAVLRGDTTKVNLKIYDVPTSINGNTGSALAGDPDIKGGVIFNGLAAGNFDTDPTTVELAIVRKLEDGTHNLGIYHAPIKLDDDIGSAIASDLDIGQNVKCIAAVHLNNPPPTESGFSENFDDGAANNWVDDGSGVWSVSDGTYQLAGKAGSTLYHSLYNNTFTDFTYQVDLMRTADDGSGDENNSQGLIFRSQDDPNQNSYNFHISASGYYLIYSMVNGSATWLTDWTYSDAIHQGFDVWNRLKVTCDGANMQFSINDTLVEAFSDGQFGSGKVGVHGYDGASHAIKNYDNAMLTPSASAGEQQAIFEPAKPRPASREETLSVK